MIGSDREKVSDRAVTLAFTAELKRLAGAVHRSMKNGNDIVALSSLPAIGPILNTLTESALNAVTNFDDDGCEELPDQSCLTGYL